MSAAESHLCLDGVVSNAERLMVLINNDRGVLTTSEEFIDDPNYEIIESVDPVNISDVLRVHDYNYLVQVQKLCEALVD